MKIGNVVDREARAKSWSEIAGMKLAIALPLVVALNGCASNTPAPAPVAPEVAASRTVTDQINARFAAKRPAGKALARIARAAFEGIGAFGPALERQFVDAEAGGLRLVPETAVPAPDLSNAKNPEEKKALQAIFRRAQRSLLDVVYPGQADAPLHVATPAGDAWLDVKLVGAQPSKRAVVDGLVVYAGAAEGVDAIYVASPERVEEYLHLRDAKAAAAVRFELTTGGKIASVRATNEGGLEAIDANGNVVLRAPLAVGRDAAGAQVSANFTVEGKSAGRTQIGLAWKQAPNAFPVLLDPSWVGTGSMVSARYWATATLIPYGSDKGKVLVAGGYAGGNALATTEIYDPNAGTWNSAGSMNAARYGHTATQLKSGFVLVVGGYNSDVEGSAELYNPYNQTWSSAGSLSTARYTHSAALLQNGDVVVVGGFNDNMTPAVLGTAEMYSQHDGGWSNCNGSLLNPRYNHTATTLNNGQVLIAGGYDDQSAAVMTTAELYDTNSDTFTATGSMAYGRESHTATLLQDGTVLVAGGAGWNAAAVRSTERYNADSGTWSSAGNLAGARYGHTATLLQDGDALVIGGFGTRVLATTERYTPGVGWATSNPMTTAREYHTATLLNNGRVLVAGGLNSHSHATVTTEIWGIADGTVCTQASDCPESFCVDGYCCNTACGAGDPNDCEACDIEGSEGTCTNYSRHHSCDDNDACTSGDECDRHGNCGGTPYTCSPNQCQSASSCDGQGGCNGTPLPVNTSCNDDVACTSSDVCDGAGNCAGAPYTCGSPPSVCFNNVGSCNGDGTCSYGFNDGASCDDGDSHTSGDSCASGNCAGTPYDCTTADPCLVPVYDGSGVCSYTDNVGARCDDNDACTQNDVCGAGDSCAGTAFSCDAAGPCQNDGTCNGDGTCAFTAKPDNTDCTGQTGSQCDTAAACQSGVCMSTATVTCAALDQCHSVGTCDPNSGICSNPTKSNGTSCDDNDACTQTDVCLTNNTSTSADQSQTTYSNNNFEFPAQFGDLGQSFTAGAAGLLTKITVSGQITAGLVGVALYDGDGINFNNPLFSDVGTVTSLGGGLYEIAIAQNIAPSITSGHQYTFDITNPNNNNDYLSINDPNVTHTDAYVSGQLYYNGGVQAGYDLYFITTLTVPANSVCTGGNPVVCTALNQCHNAGTCNHTTGQCSNPNKSDGTTCNDSVACTQNDVCTSGTCGGSGYTCGSPDQCHQAGSCNGDGTCSFANQPDGTTCNDGNPSTSNDVCTNGSCAGQAFTCNPPNQCQAAGVPDGHGGCTYAPLTGNSCDDGNDGTWNDTCTAQAACAGTPFSCNAPGQCQNAGVPHGNGPGGCTYAPNTGNSCNDNVACTQNDVCTAGVCAGTAYTCAGSDACHVGVCNGDGTCGQSNAPNNTSCDDGNVCTTTDKCTNGTCAGTPTRNAVNGNYCGAGLTAMINAMNLPGNDGHNLIAELNLFSNSCPAGPATNTSAFQSYCSQSHLDAGLTVSQRTRLICYAQAMCGFGPPKNGASTTGDNCSYATVCNCTGGVNSSGNGYNCQ